MHMYMYSIYRNDVGADNATHFEALDKVYSAAATQRFCGVRQPPPLSSEERATLKDFYLYVCVYTCIYVIIFIYFCAFCLCYVCL